MTFRVSLLFQADAKAAKAEVDGLATSARKVGDAAQDMGRKSADAARGVGGLAGAADGAEAQLRGMAAAQDVAAASQVKLGRSTTMAAGATGNLIAQFTDIGMMLAAGQNPLQLAIQQGSQITQVIGPMGAAGAAKALGAAFVGMLSPINLLTYAAIAAGAAFVKWLTSAREPTITLQERIDDLTGAVSAYREASELASASTDQLVARFGGAAGKAGEVATILQSWAQVDAVRAIDAAVDDLTLTFGGLTETITYFGRGGFGGQMLEIQATFLKLKDTLDLTAEQAWVVTDALRDLAQAPDVDAQVDAAIALNTAFIEAFGSIKNIPPELAGVARQAAMIAMQAAEMEGAMDGATDGAGRLSGAMQTVADYAIDAQTAIAALAGLEPDAGWLDHAIFKAAALANQLWSAVDAAAAYRMDATGPLPVGGPGTFPASGSPADAAPPGRPQARPTDIDFGYRPPADAGTGVGSGAAGAERDAVGDLIDKLGEELDILRAADPVQQELIRHRETLAGATEAERAEVTALIAAREAERQASEATAEMWDYLGQTAESSLMGIVTSAQSVEEAARNAATALAEAVLQGALLGEGPFGGLFGGTSVFGLIGEAIGIPAKAGGGMIHGPGDGTSDDVLMLGSAGEFVVTARATAHYRPVLEAMNAGAPLPRFARGGLIGGEGGRSRGGDGAGSGGPVTIIVDVTGARGDREIEQMVSAAVRAGLAEYDRTILPSSVLRVNGDPWRRG